MRYQRDRYKCTPLFVAATHGHEAAALALLAAGADVSLRPGYFKTSVAHAAAKGGHVEILSAVIEHGADVNAAETERQTTPLHCAAFESGAQAIDILVGAGANTKVRNYKGSTPLHTAARWCNLEALMALLRHGADVNSQDNDRQTPLHIAAAGTQAEVEMVECLLRSSADETILNDQGKAAADLVGGEHVRELLANALADRAWRRRGYLVLCRARLDRVQLMQESNSSTTANVACSIASDATLERTQASGCAETAVDSAVNERTGGDWVGVLVKVLGVQEEGIFRTIVEYL